MGAGRDGGRGAGGGARPRAMEGEPGRCRGSPAQLGPRARARDFRSDRPGMDQTHRSRSRLHANPVTRLSPLPRGLRQIDPPSLPLAD